MKCCLVSVFISVVMLFNFGVGRFSNAAASPFSKKITVSPSGREGFTTIRDAIEKGVPEDNSKWIHIWISPGTYREKVVIPRNKPYIVLEGQSRRATTIEYSSSVDITDATLQVYADNFVAKRLTFVNTYNYGESNNKRMTQATAAFIQGDKNSFYHCGFVSVQDTLFDFLGRHFFENCYIEGSVDFIFGGGQSVYQNSLLNVTTLNGDGFITAQNRNNEHDPSGFVFKFCHVIGSGNAYLGRAWGPYSRVIFYKSQLLNTIVPEGWDAWNYKGYEKHFTYAEVSCFGPGSDTLKRVNWKKKLSPAEIHYFIGPSFNNADRWIQNQP